MGIKINIRKLIPILIFLLILVATLIITSSALKFVDIGIDYVRLKALPPAPTSVPVIQSKLPVIDTPPIVEIGNITTTLSDVQIYDTPYIPTGDVLKSKDSYKMQARRLILNGDFDRAELHIYGKVKEQGRHFIYIIYGNVAGVINGVRYSRDTLNVSQTQQDGGVYTEKSAIDLTIDLLSTIQLATTKIEYENNQQTMKLKNLWQDNLLPPTAISVLIAPFSEKGIFGGAAIRADFYYHCAPGGKTCNAELCPIGKATTLCLKEKYGVNAAKDWCTRAGYGEKCKLIQ